MKALLTTAELATRLPPHTLPRNEEGTALDERRITIALEDASGVIVSHLPWLLGSDGEVTLPIPPQFAASLLSICADIAVLRLTDTVGSSEDERAKYQASIKLLEKIDTQYKGGLSGPDLQASAIVFPSKTDEIPDMRFWKKGRLF